MEVEEGRRGEGSEVKGGISYGNGDWMDQDEDRSRDEVRRREGKRRTNDLGMVLDSWARVKKVGFCREGEVVGRGRNAMSLYLQRAINVPVPI